MAPQFLTADGVLEKSTMPDLLHLNASSYEKWANSLAKELRNMGWKN
jgi:lysophospholipase L1-like esterase